MPSRRPAGAIRRAFFVTGTGGRVGARAGVGTGKQAGAALNGPRGAGGGGCDPPYGPGGLRSPRAGASWICGTRWGVGCNPTLRVPEKLPCVRGGACGLGDGGGCNPPYDSGGGRGRALLRSAARRVGCTTPPNPDRQGPPRPAPHVTPDQPPVGWVAPTPPPPRGRIPRVRGSRSAACPARGTRCRRGSSRPSCSSRHPSRGRPPCRRSPRAWRCGAAGRSPRYA